VKLLVSCTICTSIMGVVSVWCKEQQY